MEWAWGWGINKGRGYPTSAPRFTSISSFWVGQTSVSIQVIVKWKCRSRSLFWTQSYSTGNDINCLNVCVSDASRSLPEFPVIEDEGKFLPDGLLPQHIHTYQLIYREHCEVSVCVCSVTCVFIVVFW